MVSRRPTESDDRLASALDIRTQKRGILTESTQNKLIGLRINKGNSIQLVVFQLHAIVLVAIYELLSEGEAKSSALQGQLDLCFRQGTWPDADVGIAATRKMF